MKGRNKFDQITKEVIIWRGGGCHSYDRMVIGFITTYAINAYHHKSCEFEPRSDNIM
jgi:hypothetical protein